MYLQARIISFFLLSAGALALPSGTNSLSIPAHDNQTNAPPKTHSTLIKRSQRAILASFDNFECHGPPKDDYHEENLVHGEFSGHCFPVDAVHYKINIIWGTGHAAELHGRTAGICFFHDDKCKEITTGFFNDNGELPKCLKMAHNMDMYPRLDKRPWKSAKFWHSNPDKMGKEPCEMIGMM